MKATGFHSDGDHGDGFTDHFFAQKGLSPLCVEYETIAGGHWSSSDKTMEENVEKAYNEAVESMGEIYSRTVDQLLYQVPAINNLYLGVQYSHHSWNRVRCGFITDNVKNKE